MGKNSAIAWTNHTFNPWIGCRPISAGCAHCYAEAMEHRWGRDFRGTRRRTSAAYWRGPLRWAEEARQAGARQRVFCASMCDVLEDFPGVSYHLSDLWKLIDETADALDWLLLTKRADRLRFIPEDIALRAWLGVTVENQAAADERIPLLLQAPAAVRFVSMEPLLDAVDLKTWMRWVFRSGIAPNPDGTPFALPAVGGTRGLDWVIVGGESGPKARPFDLAWARSIRDQCAAAGVPFFMKQMGARLFAFAEPIEYVQKTGSPIKLKDRAGADPAEWPEDLRVQEFPGVRHG